MPASDDLAALPKAEVHVHLEGSVRPATLEEFSARAGIRVPKRFTDLPSFVETYILAWSAMSSPGDYARLVTEYCEDAARSGVRYAELTISPIGRPFDCLAEAVDAASKQREVDIRFIAEVPRNLPIEIAWAVLEAAKTVPEVVALGLGGREDNAPPELFREVFSEAKRSGLRTAPHAGEDAGPESIRGALEALGADRIQHGVRAADDPALLAELAQRRIPLAVCLTSNLRLGVVSSLDEHPIRALRDAGVLVSVNTDDPGFFGCDLAGEYAIAGRLLDLDRASYARLALDSVESSFAPESLKAGLRAGICDWARKESARHE